MNHAIASMFTGPASPPHTPDESPASESAETPQDQEAEEGGMSDAEAQHHGKVAAHLGKAMTAFARGKHKEAKVHTKLAMHHHAKAMVEAGHDLTDQENVDTDSGDNDQNVHQSGGAEHMAPGQVNQKYEAGNISR